MEQTPTSTPNVDPAPSELQQYAVRVTESDDEQAAVPETAALPDKKPRRSRDLRLLGIAGMIGLVLLLLAAATWWALARQGDDPASPPGLSAIPGDAIARINSSAPLTLTVPPARPDAAGTLDDPPVSEQWSPPLREAHRALDEGRHPSAISQFSALVGGGQGDEARAALWGLAETYEASGQRDLAIRAYTLFTGLDDPRAIRAVYRVALLHEAAGRDGEAARLFGEYARRGGPARHAAMLRQARLLGPTNEADAVYNAVLNDNPLDIDLRGALAGLAELHSRRDDHARSRDTYDRLAELEATRPRPVLDQNSTPALVLAAEQAQQADDASGARTRLLDYMGPTCTSEVAPCYYYPFGRHSAINSLLKVEPNAVVSGTVQPMLAAQTAYDAGYYNRAVTYLDTVRAQSEDPALRARASLFTGMAQQAAGSPDLAYNWYTATVQLYPQSPSALEAIRRAGDVLVRQAQWELALAVYNDALQRYPNAGQEMAQVRVNAGLLAYRLDRGDDALTLLRQVLAGDEWSTSALRADAVFWVAKVEKSRGQPAWRDTMRHAISSDTIWPANTNPAANSYIAIRGALPGSYLDLRARAILDGESDAGPLMPTLAESRVEAGMLGVRYAEEEAERSALLDWAAALSSGPTATSVPTTTTAPTAAPGTEASEVERAMLLVELGDSRAFLSLRALAESFAESGDYRSLARLVLFARYHADTQAALRVAERLSLQAALLVAGRLSLQAADDPFQRPKLLLKTLYPTPYGELVAQEARARDIDPMVMYALIRQESQFVPGARSWADARGLTQVIPSTGSGIAQQLGDSAYKLEDLYLPHVSIRYGAYYLASNLPQFDRKLLPALAAYNGGPGNAARWLDGSALRDPDLFIERVDFSETEAYLRLVYTNYAFYRAAYLP